MDIKAFIEKVNKECPEEQGIFSEPYGIPVYIKEPVIYTRYNTSGRSGRSYHENSHSRYFEYDEPSEKEKWQVLDIVLRELRPKIAKEEYDNILLLVRDNTGTDDEDYYGNYVEFKIEYIVLSDLLKLLNII